MTAPFRPLAALRSLFGAKRQLEGASGRRFANRPASGNARSWIGAGRSRFRSGPSTFA